MEDVEGRSFWTYGCIKVEGTEVPVHLQSKRPGASPLGAEPNQGLFADAAQGDGRIHGFSIFRLFHGRPFMKNAKRRLFMKANVQTNWIAVEYAKGLKNFSNGS